MCVYECNPFGWLFFIELTEMVFTIPGVKVFLSEKLSQDTPEKFFWLPASKRRDK